MTQCQEWRRWRRHISVDDHSRLRSAHEIKSLNCLIARPETGIQTYSFYYMSISMVFFAIFILCSYQFIGGSDDVIDYTCKCLAMHWKLM